MNSAALTTVFSMENLFKIFILVRYIVGFIVTYIEDLT